MLRYVDVLAVGAGLIVYKNNSRKVFASTVVDEAKDGVTDDRVVFQACLGWAELSAGGGGWGGMMIISYP